MDVDRFRITQIAQQPDDALRLAERIGADEMRPLGKLRDGLQQPAHFLAVRRVPENRQAERGFGDEDVALHRLERYAGRVGLALVVARGDDADAVVLNADLRGTEHMAGRVEGHLDAVEVDRLAERGSLAWRRRSRRRSGWP